LHYFAHSLPQKKKADVAKRSEAFSHVGSFVHRLPRIQDAFQAARTIRLAAGKASAADAASVIDFMASSAIRSDVFLR